MSSTLREQSLPASSLGESEPPWVEVGYVSDDASWALWVQLLLDGRVVPEAEMQRPTRLGFPRPSKVSVQLCELAKADSLNDFDVGKWLIVIISKASAAHKGLGTLMGRFRAAGGEERIIAVVVDSDPGFSSPGDDCSTWIPRWLSWRYKAGRFVQADSSEPMVVDGRGGVSTLDTIGRGMLSTVLDLDAGLLLQSMPTSPEPPARKATGKRVPAPRGNSSKLPSKPGTNPKLSVVGSPASSSKFLLMGVVGAVLTIGGFLAFFLQTRSASTEKSPFPQPTVETIGSAAASAPAPLPETLPRVSTSSTPSASVSQAPPPVPALEMATPPSAQPVVASGPDASPAPPVEEEPAIVEPPAWERWIARGDRHLDGRDHEHAIEYYVKALSAMRPAAEAAPRDSDTQNDFGDLSLKVAALQQHFASTAEAVATLTTCRRVFGGTGAPTATKGKGSKGKAATEAFRSRRGEILAQIDASLARMAREGANF